MTNLLEANLNVGRYQSPGQNSILNRIGVNQTLNRANHVNPENIQPVNMNHASTSHTVNGQLAISQGMYQVARGNDINHPIQHNDGFNTIQNLRSNPDLNNVQVFGLFANMPRTGGMTMYHFHQILCETSHMTYFVQILSKG
jgi:hypothetical protein